VVVKTVELVVAEAEAVDPHLVQEPPDKVIMVAEAQMVQTVSLDNPVALETI
jgi:hypothetical protein